MAERPPRRKSNAPAMPPALVPDRRDLTEWAGGTRVTLAVVLTDVVGSTALGERLKDERMRQVLRAHFAQCDRLITRYRGRRVKTIGDGVVAVFRTAADALDFARELHADPGWPELHIRAGIHVGAIDIEAEDVAGIEMHVAARLVEGITGAEVWVTDRAKADIDGLGAEQHLGLHWQRHPDRRFRGIDGRRFTLWALALPANEMSVSPSPPGGQSEPVRVSRVKTQRSSPVRSSPVRGSTVHSAAFDDRPAIAVLPFADFSGDPGQSHFSDGIAGEIIDELSSWRLFPVIARNSTFAFKGQALDSLEVGRRVGARYIVEGSINSLGQRVRISARLVDAVSNLQVATERFDSRFDELPELHDQVTEMIVGSIAPEVLRAERRRALQKPRRNLTSYEYFLRGLEAHYAYTKPDNAEAQVNFRQAIEADPQNAQAYAALALAMVHAVQLGWRNDSEHSYAVADGLAAKALALDPRAPSAHFALGLTSMMLGRIDKALREVREAIRINPSHAAAHAIMAPLLCYAGEPSAAGLDSAKRAIRLSPYDPRLGLWLTTIAQIQYFLAAYEEAVDYGRQAITLIADNPVAHRFAAASLGQLGRAAEAAPSIAAIRHSSAPTLAAIRSSVAHLYRDPGMIEHMLDGLRKAGLE
jgi:adenylate cyclase